MKPRLSCCCCCCCCLLHGCVLLLLLLCSERAGAQVQQQTPPRTDPTEAAAVNAMMARLGLSAPASWNISGEPCSGAATDDTPLDDNPGFNPAIKCDCSDQNSTLCHVTRLKINTLDVVGPIPEELRNLTHLIKLFGLSIYDKFLGGIEIHPSKGMRLFASTGYWSPKLGGSKGEFVSPLVGPKIARRHLCPSLPPCIHAIRFGLPWGLNCLQRSTPCFLGSPRFFALAALAGLSVWRQKRRKLSLELEVMQMVEPRGIKV
ncbi:hypothetical protein ABZP36_007975 [Zizania latifolia]